MKIKFKVKSKYEDMEDLSHLRPMEITAEMLLNHKYFITLTIRQLCFIVYNLRGNESSYLYPILKDWYKSIFHETYYFTLGGGLYNYIHRNEKNFVPLKREK